VGQAATPVRSANLSPLLELSAGHIMSFWIEVPYTPDIWILAVNWPSQGSYGSTSGRTQQDRGTLKHRGPHTTIHYIIVRYSHILRYN
jgi:hypothetical protein